MVQFLVKIFEVAIIKSYFALQELYIIALFYVIIKATVCSIRYFNWQKSQVAFLSN